MNGYAKASHIKSKLNEMIHLTETLYACSIACSAEGVQLPSGQYFVNMLLANVGKHNVTRYIYEIDRLAHDIAGGFIATLPSQADLESPEVGKYVEKYFKGVDGVSTADRMRVARLIEVMTGGTALAESMHGASDAGPDYVFQTGKSGSEEESSAQDCRCESRRLTLVVYIDTVSLYDSIAFYLKMGGPYGL